MSLVPENGRDGGVPAGPLPRLEPSRRASTREKRNSLGTVSRIVQSRRHLCMTMCSFAARSRLGHHCWKDGCRHSNSRMRSSIVRGCAIPQDDQMADQSTRRLDFAGQLGQLVAAVTVFPAALSALLLSLAPHPIRSRGCCRRTAEAFLLRCLPAYLRCILPGHPLSC